MKGQVSFEFLVAIAVYVSMVTALIHVQGELRSGLNKGLGRTDTHRELSKTADICSYRYFHGPSVSLEGNFTLPGETENSKIFTVSQGERIYAKSFSPSISPYQGGLKCSSIKPFYP